MADSLDRFHNKTGLQEEGLRKIEGFKEKLIHLRSMLPEMKLKDIEKNLVISILRTILSNARQNIKLRTVAIIFNPTEEQDQIIKKLAELVSLLKGCINNDWQE
jgi:hypothetical protein